MPKKKQKLNMLRINIYLPVKLKAEVDKYSAKTGARLAAVVRLALEAFLKERNV